MTRKLLTGKGAQYNPPNSFQKNQVDWEAEEAYERAKPPTKVYHEYPWQILSKNNSPDLHFDYSVNPYQGCEHGCSYCYARTTHEYWGFSAGLDFESQIMVKFNAPDLLKKQLSNSKWKGELIMFSGNTDCYQPLEKKYELTRKLLSVCLDHRQAINIITKNHLIQRDMDLLREMSALQLVAVCLSITSLDESLRRVMEPRTSTASKRIETVKLLADAGIPVSVNIAPVIPYLNLHELPELIECCFNAGAYDVNYATVRLNGVVGDVFRDWLKTHFPDRSEKVWNAVGKLHGGAVSEHQFGKRMKGEGTEAQMISQLFHKAKNKYFPVIKKPKIDHTIYRRSTQPTLF